MFDLKGYGLTLLSGTVLTIESALVSLIVAVLLGAVGALAKASHSTVAQTIAGVYTTVVRGVPDLVLMLLIFFGGQMLINQLVEALGYDTYIEVSAFTAGVATIGFIYGAYMTETFRGAILAVPHGQLEAGHAFGMSPSTDKRAVVFRRTSQLLPKPGSACRIVCGSRIRQRTWSGLMPKAWPASSCPAGTARMAPRKVSVM